MRGSHTFSVKPTIKLKYILKYLSKLQNYFHLKNDMVLIYSMGKVGSTTIHRTLSNLFPLNHIYHVHYLSSYYLQEVLPSTPHSGQIDIGSKVLDQIKKCPNHRKKIISVVRDPIEMGISFLFEVPEDYFGTKDITSIDRNKIESTLNEFDHSYSLNWFDYEFKNYTGVDVFKMPFDKNKGYSIYNLDEYDILVIRLENFKTDLIEALSEFFSFRIPRLINSNLTSSKGKGKLQKEIKKGWKANKEILDHVYSSKFCRHFYADKEIADLRAKWS